MPRTKPVPITVRVSFKGDVAVEQLRSLAKYLGEAQRFLDKMDISIQKARNEFKKIIEQTNKVDELFDFHAEPRKEEEKESRIVK